MLTIAIASLGAASFAASGYAIYKSAAGRTPTLLYYAIFFSPAPLALAAAIIFKADIAFSGAAVALGALLFFGNLLLSASYRQGPGLATAIALSLASALAIGAGALLLGDSINAAGWLGVACLVAATFVGVNSEERRERGQDWLWPFLLAATCSVLAARAVLVSWRLAAVPDVLSLVLVAYAAASILAIAGYALARLWRFESLARTKAEAPGLAAAAGLLSMAGLACFGFAARGGEVIVANAVFGVYPAITVLAIAIDNRTFQQPGKLAAAALAAAGVVILATRTIPPL